MDGHFADRLFEAARRAGSVAAVGIDPTPAVLPPALAEQAGRGGERLAHAYAAFGAGLVRAAAGRAAAVKPNIAFFEAAGLAGLAAYQTVCAAARRLGLLVIGDVKRGDIGGTAAAYAEGLLHDAADGDDALYGGRLGPHDAITVNPYLGADGVRPFIDKAAPAGKGLFVLLRTSNPSADDFQTLPLADGRRVVDAVAARIDAWGADHVGAAGYSAVGAVVGATRPDELARLRQALPRTPFLVPGYGAQGGGAADVAGAFDADGRGAVVNASRTIMAAWKRENAPDDWEGAAVRALEAMNRGLAAVVTPR